MSKGLLITNARIMSPTLTLRSGWLVCHNGRIDAMGSGIPLGMGNMETIDARGLLLLPGFIDVHVHGAKGCDTMDASVESLATMAEFYATHGVTSFLATTWTASRDRISAALTAVKDYISGTHPGAQLLGVHLEGPYLNPSKCGAQNAEHIRRAMQDEALEFLDSGVIRLVSLAPEYQENHWLIEACVERGITISAAHTDATYDEIRTALAHGLRHATHTFNAMRGLHHREPGTVGAVLNASEIRCELIADNIHVHPAAMQLLWRAKGREGTVLITDATAVTGLPEGNHILDERPVVVRDGAVRLENGSLAGSTLTMDRALRTFVAATGETINSIWPVTSLNPAAAIGISDQKGSIESGKDADLVLIDDDFKVYLTIVGGQVVYSALENA